MINETLRYIGSGLYHLKERIKEKKFDFLSSPEELADFIVQNFEDFVTSKLEIIEGHIQHHRKQKLDDIITDTFTLYGSFVYGNLTSEDLVPKVREVYKKMSQTIIELPEENSMYGEEELSTFDSLSEIPYLIYTAHKSRLIQALEIAKPRLKTLIGRLENQGTS